MTDHALEKLNSASDYLLAEHHRRRQKNDSFSLRSFARFLHISPSLLSAILRHKSTVSMKMALRMADLMGLQGKEREYFLLLAAKDAVKNTSARDVINERLNLFQGESEFWQLQKVDLSELYGSIETFVVYAALGCLESNQISVENLIEKTGYTSAQIEDALNRIVRLGLLQWREGKLVLERPNSAILFTDNAVELIRNTQRRVIALSAQSIDSHEITKDRITWSHAFSFSPEDVNEIDNLTNQYMESLGKLCEKTKGGNKDVFLVSLNIFKAKTPKPTETSH